MVLVEPEQGVGVHTLATRRHREASSWDKKPRSIEAAVRNGRPRQRQLPRPQLDPRPSSTPALPPPARPHLSHPLPARPRAHPPPGAGTPRRRAGTRGCCSGTRSRSAAPGRPATHSGAERAGRFIRSPSSGCTNLRPCPHPEARPEPEVTSSNRAPAVSSCECCVFTCGSLFPALLQPCSCFLSSWPGSPHHALHLLQAVLRHRARPPPPWLGSLLTYCTSWLCCGPKPPPPGPALSSHPRLLTCILLGPPLMHRTLPLMLEQPQKGSRELPFFLT